MGRSPVTAGILGQWSEWVPLQGVGRDRGVPTTAGLYRIRRLGDAGLDYVGQTGGSLRGRLGMLAGVYQPEMPYRDPHFAAPCLWALRHSTGCEFEASVVEMPDASVVERKALEALAVTLYRVEIGRSPTANFGRMPPGYRASSANNSKLVSAGKRFRGGPDSAAPLAAPSLPVHGDLDSDPQAPVWMGWGWSEWEPATAVAQSGIGTGLYRVRGTAPGLVYVGQGRISARVRVHLTKATIPGHQQAGHFAGEREVSWVTLPDAPTVHLLEHENDLIAAHVLTLGQAPAAQFLG